MRGRCPRRSGTRTRRAARPVLVVGGPRFDPSAAGGLGVDAIFGRGTTPGEVASYLAATLGPEPAGSPAQRRAGPARGAVGRPP